MSTQQYVNPSALLPRAAFLTVAVAVVLSVAGLLFLISGPSIILVLVAAGVGILLCNAPRLPAWVTVSLVRVALRLRKHARAVWLAFIGDPYRPFAYTLLFATTALLLAPHVTSVILLNSTEAAGGQLLTSENTLVISLLGTFIPFVFAAASFTQNRVAQRVPELIAQQALGWANTSVWCFLVTVFLFALAMPLLGMKGDRAAVMQLGLLAVAFLTVVVFVACVLRVADFRNLAPCFRETSERRLRRLFSQHMPLPHIPGARVRDFLDTHVTGLCGRSMESLLGLGPMTVTKECSDEAIRVAEALMEMAKRGIRNDSVSEAAFSLEQLATYASCYFWLRQHHRDASDAFNLHLASETRKLVNSCATEEREKFLDTMCQTIRAIGLSACQYTGMGLSAAGNALLIPWEEMVGETVISASSLKNTAYPNDGIGVLGDFGEEAIRRGHINTVEFGLMDRLINLGVRFAASDWAWHSVMVSKTLGALNQLFLEYAKELPRQGFPRERFLQVSWAKAVNRILVAKLDDYTPDAFWQPFARIVSPLDQPHQLLSCYRDALQYVGREGIGDAEGSLRRWGRPCTAEDARLMIAEMREQLVVVHAPFAALLESTRFLSDMEAWSNLCSSLACLFWLDLAAATDPIGVTEQWTNSVVQHYRALFSRMSTTVLAARNAAGRGQSWLDDFSDLAGIPALGLTFRNEGNARLVDGVLQCYCEMLLSLFAGYEAVANKRKQSQEVSTYMLLVSAWLTLAKSPLPICAELQATLKAHPITIPVTWLTEDPKMRAYPSDPMGGGCWHLFPSCFWSNQVQEQVKGQLMTRAFLEKYAEEFVVLPKEEVGYPPSEPDPLASQGPGPADAPA